MALIEKGVLDREDLCVELELLADTRRDEGDDDPVVGGLVSLIVSLRAGGAS